MTVPTSTVNAARWLAPALLAAAASAQSAPSAGPKAAADAWPKLDGAKADELRLAIVSLKKTLTPAGVEEMTSRITSFGKGAVPVIYESLARATGEDHARLLKPLEALVAADDGPRIAADCSSKLPPVRLFALRKAAELGAAGALPAAKKALAEKDDEIRFQAALTTWALGSNESLPTLLQTAKSQWPKLGPRMRAALEKNRSEEATQKLLPGLRAKEWQDVCASLRMLAGVGVPSASAEIKKLLDSEDARIKEDAINALRGVVDKAPPLERLSAFDLAEQANAWKRRV